MEYVPGLMPQREEGQGGGRRSQKQGRTPVNEPESRIKLQPSQGVGQYYARPGQPQVNQKAKQFIQALGQVSQVSGKLGQYMHEKQTKEAEAQAHQAMQSMSLDEAKEKVKAGEFGKYDNPYFQDAFQRQFGIRLGISKGREMQVKYETGFDPRNDDIDEFIKGHLDPEMEGMAGNEIIAGAFTETVDQSVGKLRERNYTDRAAMIEQDALDGAYEAGVQQFDARIADAKTPEQRKAAIDEGYKAWREGAAERRELLGLTNPEQDALTLQMAAKFAREGDLDVVEKLLMDERDGVGAIIDKRGEMGANAAKILNEAENNFENDNREQTFDTRLGFFDQAREGNMSREELLEFHKSKPGAYTDAQVMSLISNNERAQDAKRQQLLDDRIGNKLANTQHKERTDSLTDTLSAMRDGSVHNLQPTVITTGYDDNGQPEYEMLSPEDQVENAQEYLHNVIIPEYASQFDEEERGMRAFEYEAAIYSSNPGMEHPQWGKTLKGSTAALSIAAQGGDVPPKLMEGLSLYEQLKETAPGLLDVYMSEDDITTYDNILASETYFGTERDQAVQHAAQATTNDFDTRHTQVTYQDMDKEIKKLGDAGNPGYVSSEFTRIHDLQVASGGMSDMEAVRERFERQNQNINGHWVPTSGKNIPGNFKETAEAKIQEYAETHEAELTEKGLEASDLTIYPMGGSATTGSWAIIDGSSSTPMNDQIGSQFTTSQLLREAEERTKQKAADEADAANRRKEKGIPNERMERPDDPRLRGLQESYETEPEQGGFDTNAARDRLLNPDGQKQAEPESEEPVDVMSIDPSEGTPVPSSNVDDAQARQPVQGQNVNLPANEDNRVKEAVTMLREEGWSKRDFDEYVKDLARDGSGNSFIVNPELRERIRYYLPTA